MESPNAAVQIRAALGCYNIMLHKTAGPVKRKSASYGASLQAHFDKVRLLSYKP